MLAIPVSILAFFSRVDSLRAQSDREPVATFKHSDQSHHRQGLEPQVFGEGKQLLTWSDDDRTAKTWPISGGEAVAVDLETPGEEQIRQFEVRTGTLLERSGLIRALTVAEWEVRKEADHR